MEKGDAIEYLDNLERGQFLTVNIPISLNNQAKITAMYMGKDKEGRYNFIDSGRFILSKDFLEKENISIDKEYNGDEAIEIHAKFKREQEQKKKHHQRENR